MSRTRWRPIGLLAYARGMSRTERVTVTVPADVLAAAKKTAEARGFRSLSGYVSHLLAEEERDDLQEIIDELIALHGEPTPEDREWAENLTRRPASDTRESGQNAA